MSMIEKAARGIAVNGFGRDWDDFDELSATDTDQTDLMDYARAAIAAIRDPDEGMLEAMPTHAPGEIRDLQTAQWQAGIDAILTDRS